MDDAKVIAPAKKRKTETDYQKCVICQKKLATEVLVAILKYYSIINVLNLSRERHKYRDTVLAEFVQRTVNETVSIISEKKGSYHRNCCKEFSNRSKLERVIDRFQKAVQHKKPLLSQNKTGRPSLGTISSPVNESDTLRTLRSSSGIFNKTMCIICQKPRGNLNEVQYKATGKTMLSIAKKHDNDSV